MEIQGPLRNELLVIFGAERQRGEIRHVMELLSRRGRTESQAEVLRCLERLVADELIEAPRGVLTDAKVYQATEASLRALSLQERRVKGEREQSRETKQLAGTGCTSCGTIERSDAAAAPEPGQRWLSRNTGAAVVIESRDSASVRYVFAEGHVGAPWSTPLTMFLASYARARTIQDLAREVLAASDTGDLRVVAQALARAVHDLRDAAPHLDADGRNRHPVARLWTEKIAHLAGMPREDLQPGDQLSIRMQVQRLAESAP